MAVILVVGIVAGVSYISTANKGIEVKTYVADIGPVMDYIEDVGEVVADDSLTVYTDLSGKIDSLQVEVGSKVRADQVIAKIDSGELSSQVKVLQAKLDGLNAYVKELKKPVDKNLLNKLDSLVKSRKIELDRLTASYDNQKKLLESGATSSFEVDELAAKLAIANESYTAALSDYKIAAKGTSVNVINQTLGDIHALEAQIMQQSHEVGKSEVKAGIDGVIVEKQASTGDYLTPGSPLVTIARLEQKYIKADLLADDLFGLQIGSRVIITNESGFETVGVIRKIHPKAFTKRSDLGVDQKRVTVEIELTNQNDQTNQNSNGLLLGYEYDLQVILKEEKGIRLPDSSIFKIEGVPHVFIVNNGRVELKKIEVLLEGVDYYLVKGINVGDQVVQTPAATLEPGTKVKIEGKK